MGHIAFVFSGQGDQHPGMGKELCEKYPAASRVFALCDSIRPGTSEQCFNGTEEELKETKNTQPCLFAVELAGASVLLDKGVMPSACAGFSLGEVTAAAFSGMFGCETGFRLVMKRGELMQEAAEKADTSMAAVVRLTADEVKELCAGFQDIYPVNFNSPGQTAVSGLSSVMPDFSAAVKKAGGRAIPLKVKGAFHSPFMQEAAEAFGRELKGLEAPRIPLYSNLTGGTYDACPDGSSRAELLSKQICSPVQWEKTVRNMIAAGIDTFIEVGPGKTLTNLIGKISPDVRAVSIGEYLSEVEGC